MANKIVQSGRTGPVSRFVTTSHNNLLRAFPAPTGNTVGRPEEGVAFWTNVPPYKAPGGAGGLGPGGLTPGGLQTGGAGGGSGGGGGGSGGGGGGTGGGSHGPLF